MMRLVPHTIINGRVYSVRVSEAGTTVYPCAAVGKWPVDRHGKRISFCDGELSEVFWATHRLRDDEPLSDTEWAELRATLNPLSQRDLGPTGPEQTAMANLYGEYADE